MIDGDGFADGVAGGDAVEGDDEVTESSAAVDEHADRVARTAAATSQPDARGSTERLSGDGMCGVLST
jgi:hypothetical protein